MNCSATAVAMIAGIAGTLAFTVMPATVYGEATEELDDAAGRLQYAFYTGDTRSLEEVLGLIGGFEVDGTLAAARSYQLAYGHWKLAQLYTIPPADNTRANTRSQATKAAQACMKHAQATIALDPKMAEVYAIDAVCDGVTPARAGVSGCARSRGLRTALEMAPDNPRVQLIRAMCAMSTTADPAAVETWKAVVTTFEAAPPSRPGKPDWGHAEALVALGEGYLQKGETVAARDVLERALVLAPDYRHAQNLLQTAATRPR